MTTSADADGQQAETSDAGWHGWEKTPPESRGFVFGIARIVWVIGVFIAFILASPILAPYYAFEKIYGRIKWAYDSYQKIVRWAKERGTLYLILRVIWLVLVLLLFILIAPILAPYYAVKRICQRVKWAYNAFPYVYPYVERFLCSKHQGISGGVGAAHLKTG